ncbi:HEAT repeat-containing protein 3 [Patella vulgata]|uniref:HEAT repeat-containing protein 3 n=1 Tax=Patella vulgata TaxID=6465 RepID=UPI002180336F|nr:HEAT repeat-containing protein 3 [Patella vulgata]
MGKDRKKKFKAPKQQPTGLPSVREFEAELRNGDNVEVDNEPSGVVAEVLEKLQSGSVEEREIGCSILVSLVSQQEAVPVLLKHNIIKILGPLIVDPSPDVRCRSLGALRNLSVDGGHEVCEEMIKKDVMTPLVALFHKYGPLWTPETEDVKCADTSVDIYVEAVHLLWNLCESCDIAVKIFNKENLIECLLPCLNYDVYTYPLSLAVAQCLHTVAEDNKQVATFCKENGIMGNLEKLACMSCDTSDSLLLRTLVTGIMINVCGDELTSTAGCIISAILKSAGDVLDVNIVDKISTVEVKIQENGSGDAAPVPMEEAGASAISETSDHSIALTPEETETSKLLKEIDNLLTAQRISAEIVANLCCSDDDESEELHESSSTEDLQNDEEMEDNFSQLCLSSEVHSQFINNDIFTKLLNKSECLSEDNKNILEASQDGRKVIRSFSQVQVHSLLSAHNMVNAMDANDLGGLNKLETVWEGLAKLSTSKQATEDKNFLEAVTSAMRAVIQKLAQLKSPKFSDVTSNDLQFLYTMGKSSYCTSIRVNTIRIIATVGCLLATNIQPHPILKDIGLFLVENCKDQDLWVVAEALDSIFDVFGEDHIDSIVKEIDLIQKLRTILPPLKAKISLQKKKLGDKYPIIATARTNLIRFIRYKS